MSVTVYHAEGIFKASDSPYKATAVKALEEIQDFKGKTNSDRTKVLRDAMIAKHPELKWYTICFT
jgi:hypothetical protein